MAERVLTSPIDPITAPVRSRAVDIVKGLAIFLVVYETGQGMSSRGWWTGASRTFSDLYVYSFHMPLSSLPPASSSPVASSGGVLGASRWRR